MAIAECRLCLDSTLEGASASDAELIQPCQCSSFVHRGCLKRWQDVQQEQFLQSRRSTDESTARAGTCEVCGSRLVTTGDRSEPPAKKAVCRAHGGFGKVSLRKFPTLSRDSRNFSDYAASEGQELEVLERDESGEFFRVRARNAARYREEGRIQAAEGWIRHTYLEWPADSQKTADAALPAPRMPPAYANAESTAGEIRGEESEALVNLQSLLQRLVAREQAGALDEAAASDLHDLRRLLTLLAPSGPAEVAASVVPEPDDAES